MALEIEDDRDVRFDECTHCQQPMTRIAGFVLKDGGAHAIYFATCYHHDGHEVWIDVVFSPTWDDTSDDRVTFGCRVGPIEGQPEGAASLVPAAQNRRESRTFGYKLTRDEALLHPQLAEFWEVVDYVLLRDPDVSEHMYGRRPEAPTNPGWFSRIGTVVRSTFVRRP